jgi:hypothetical protein
VEWYHVARLSGIRESGHLFVTFVTKDGRRCFYPSASHLRHSEALLDWEVIESKSLWQPDL